MKHLLLTTIAAVVLVGCGESQQSAPAPETKPEPPTAEAPDISIHKAAEVGNIEALKKHLAAGTDVNARDKDGWTPLDWSGVHEPEITKLLLRYGGKKADWFNAGNSIHAAAQAGHIEAVKKHLANGADVNAKTNSGELTPLHIASMNGHKEIVKLLINEGAKINPKDDKGFTPIDRTLREPEIADLLRKHGGKTGEELKVIVESYEVLRVSCGPRGNTYMPFTSWQVGGKEPIGYDPDLIKLIAKEIGVVVKFIDAQSLFNKWRETAVDPRLSVLSEDIADVSLYAITINNERKKLVDFSEPYFTDGLSILVKRESGILSLNELKGKKILAPSNTVAYPWTKKNLTQSIIVSEITNFIPNDLILKGAVDAYIADRVNLLAISSKDNRLVVLPRRLTTDHLGIAVKKGNTELLGKINAALIKFKENGALKELEAKWF